MLYATNGRLNHSGVVEVPSNRGGHFPLQRARRKPRPLDGRKRIGDASPRYGSLSLIQNAIAFRVENIQRFKHHILRNSLVRLDVQF